MKTSYILLLTLSTNLVVKTTSDTKSDDRLGKFLSVFQIVEFPNDTCNGGSRNGTCYTASECTSRGGTNSGTCANGYGICCVFTVGCGSMRSENCTYFESNNVSPGDCSASICPCSSNICQLRLDFETFVISGPSTDATSVTKVLFGITNPGGAAVTLENQCLTDSFSVASPSGNNPPVICGMNNGQHIFVDVPRGVSMCTDLAFQLGTTGIGTPLANRQWTIKATQYSCDSLNRAPAGCTQYFTGSSGSVQTFNYDGGNHLADQEQTICVRREPGSCRICWSPAIAGDFAVSGTVTTKGFNTGGQCCGYGANGMLMNGYDCVQIPGALKDTANADMAAASRFCGGKLVTAVTTVSKTICSERTPFLLRFNSDTYEWSAETGHKGFQLGYTQESMNCP